MDEFELDIPAFKTWLESQQPEAIVGRLGDAACCPVINYLRTTDPMYGTIYHWLTKMECSGEAKRVGSITHKLIMNIDEYHDNIMTLMNAQECLEVVNNFLN